MVEDIIFYPNVNLSCITHIKKGMGSKDLPMGYSLENSAILQSSTAF